ncbi:chromosome segregation and condensation protein ScpA [Deferribacter desulfuricans SSM1]|uniref:Segregation and condensation protein A n=1 Tax=Deferribacter desulfuricans (strain DSM 14783 / JCM 11476 / NBRC 101012 / SSM1) TaxID=639282 RepID=D3PD01_DEFDS|nr:segregation/condensation protein A [Deferribacter desulfuricans]BAI80474.1 chromosome segregation and condensation protein ScpA [Deferribacter desulfuricans SSM1]
MGDLLEIKLDNFEGPLDLLIHLIYKNEMNIYDISISVIADQFINAINTMEEMDIEVASDFIQMASYLIYLKSKMLLPHNSIVEDDIDIEEEKFLFTQRLIEYSFFKDVAEILREREQKYSTYLTREESITLEKDYSESMDAYQIARLFFNLIKKEDKKIIKIEKKNIDINEIIENIKALVFENELLFWQNILDRCRNKMEVVVSFLAILELIKLKVVVAIQESNFENFVVKRNG